MQRNRPRQLAKYPGNGVPKFPYLATKLLHIYFLLPTYGLKFMVSRGWNRMTGSVKLDKRAFQEQGNEIYWRLGECIIDREKSILYIE